MLKGTDRKPDEIVCEVPPRMASLTVEMTAIHAVMAGCEPEYMPVLIAAMEAFMDPEHGWRASTTTTNPVAPLLVVNGPIVKEIGLNFSTGALGGGAPNKPNVTIGYAINLIGDIVGGSIAPSADKSTLGQTANIIAMVLGENEDANPWGPQHVELGYQKSDSTVTVFGVRSFVNNNIHDCKTAEDILTVMAEAIKGAGLMGENPKPCTPGSKELVVFGPEHAAQLFEEGWTKEKIQKFFYDHIKVSRNLFHTRYSGNLDKIKGIMTCFKEWEKWDRYPLVVNPKDFRIIVSGGPGKHSVYMSTNGYNALTKKIECPKDRGKAPKGK